MAHVPWWVFPSAAALILVATHTYLGLHVISRNVFFVDLALAQVAALGSTVAYLYGFEMADPVTYFVSLLFAVGGAWFFSVARVRENRVPQEAIIGLAFAIASAGAILLSAENPHGAEHLRDMMAGSILVVSPRGGATTVLISARVVEDRGLLVPIFVYAILVAVAILTVTGLIVGVRFLRRRPER